MLLSEVSAHLAVPSAQICELTSEDMPIDPEEGITFEVSEAVRLGMKEKGDVWEVWSGLWRLLFPGDGKVLSPYYEPPVEHFELWDFVRDKFPLDAVLEFAASAEPSWQATLEERIRRVLDKTFESFPSPCQQLGLGGQTTTSTSSVTDSGPGSTAAPTPPVDDTWNGSEVEEAPWLGWFEPPGAISLASHIPQQRDP